MNNLKIVFPQKGPVYPQKYQHFFQVFNKKKPEVNQELWAKNPLLLGKDKLFLLINKFVSAKLNLIIYFYTLTKTTKSNLNMVKSSSMGKI
jgi:hypothetical protein